MKIVLAHNHYNEKHLDEVIEDMKLLGPPTIRVFDLGFDDLFQAVEGCHRLRACEILEIEPILDIIGEDEKVCDIEGLDFDGAEYIKEIGDWENYSIEVL